MNIAIYCRDLQFDGNEIIRQILACESFLKINMINREPDVYIDIGFCVFSHDRPMFLKMVRKAIDLDLDMILVDRDSWSILSINPTVINDMYYRIKDLNMNFKIYSISEGGLENKSLIDLI